MAKHNTGKKPLRIEVSYEKSPYFRAVPVNGAYGGANSHGEIRAGIYSESVIYPTHSLQEVIIKGETVKLKEVPVHAGNRKINRTLEVELVFQLNSAISFHAWLGKKIEHIEGKMILPAEQLPSEVTPADQ
jgi:hypothetical protein